jgi:hypothetical protein
MNVNISGSRVGRPSPHDITVLVKKIDSAQVVNVNVCILDHWQLADLIEYLSEAMAFRPRTLPTGDTDGVELYRCG